MRVSSPSSPLYFVIYMQLKQFTISIWVSEAIVDSKRLVQSEHDLLPSLFFVCVCVSSLNGAESKT